MRDLRLKFFCLVCWVIAVAIGCVHPVIDGRKPPKPPDVKTAEQLFVVTVVDTPVADQDTAAVLDKLARGIPPHTFAELTPASASKLRYDAYVQKAGGPPCVLFFDVKTKSEIGEAKMPTKWDDLQKLIDVRTKK